MDKKLRQAKAKGKKGSTTETVTTPVAEVKEPKEAKPQPVAADGVEMPALPKIPRAKAARKPKPTKPCACGCLTPTTGMWAPGHDARATGWAIRIERGVPVPGTDRPMTVNDVPANERAGAKLKLAERKAKASQGPSGVIEGGKGKVVNE